MSRSEASAKSERLMWDGGGKYYLFDPKGIELLIKLRNAEYQEIYTMPENIAKRMTESVDQFMSGGLQIFTVGKEKMAKDKPVFVYVHGGGYTANIVESQWYTAQYLTQQTGYGVYLPLYKLAWKHTFEEAYESMTVFWKELCEKHDPSKIVLMGDSAGGGLALGLCQQWKDKNIPMPGRLILFSPWVDLKCDNPKIAELNLESKDPMLAAPGLVKMAEGWANGTDLKDPRLSPIYGDFTGLPKMYVFGGTREIFWPDNVRCYEAAKAAGVDVTYIEGEDQNHVYPIYITPTGGIPEAKEALAIVINEAKTL